MNRTAELAVSLSVPVALTGTVLTALPAHADDRICRGAIGARQFDDDVVVPKGPSCTLVGTRIDGKVFVRGNATLLAKGVRVGGNIRADNHKTVIVRHRKVDQEVKRSRVQLKQGGGGKLLRAVVDSDIQQEQRPQAGWRQQQGGGQQGGPVQGPVTWSVL